MPTTTYWTGGGTEGDWTSAGNWSNGVPSGTTFIAILDDATDTIDTNINQASVVLVQLIITAGFKGNIGGSGSSLEIDSALTRIGTAGEYVNIDGNHTTMIVEPAGNAEVNIIGDDITTLRVLRGKVTVGTGVAVSNMEVDGGNVEIGSNARNLAYNQNGGYVISERQLQNCNMYGGTLVLEANAGISGSAILGGNSTLIKRSGGAAAAINSLTKYGSASYKMTGATDSTTITTGFIYSGSGGFDKSGGAATTTVTTENNYGGGSNT